MTKQEAIKKILSFLKFYYTDIDIVTEIVTICQKLDNMKDQEKIKISDFNYYVKCHIRIDVYDNKIRQYELEPVQ